MNRAGLAAYLESIREPGAADPMDVRQRLDRLTKPRGSLGRIEDLAAQLAIVLGYPVPELKSVITVLAADHGVTAEGVSLYPADVTAQMCFNYASGGAAINALARAANAHLVVADLGVKQDLEGISGVRSMKVARGTHNLLNGPAMSEDDSFRAIECGIEIVNDQADSNVFALGEMGIGNTTAAAAITAAMLDLDPALVVGAGTGLDSAGVVRKVDVVRRAVRRLDGDSDPLVVLSQLGGFEIAGLVGVILAASSAAKVVLLDGFITGAAALIASGVSPACRAYMVASHSSVEPGHRIQLEHLGLRPLLDLDLRLGEGSGAALALPLLAGSRAIINDMATFESAGVSGAEGS